VGVGVAVVMGRPARLTSSNWLGILLGTVGVAALVGLDVAGSDLIGVAQLSLVVVGYAFGPAILSRWMSDLPGIGVVAASLALAAIIYIPIVAVTGSFPTAWPSLGVVGSVIALGVVCSALAFLLMFALIAEIGPMRMTTITYVNPAVAIVAGALVLGEAVTVVTIVGFALVLGGSYLVTRKRAPEIPADPDAAPAVAEAAAGVEEETGPAVSR
jgi:drug/metabolite transporter (DMT)-like permease